MSTCLIAWLFVICSQTWLMLLILCSISETESAKRVWNMKHFSRRSKLEILDRSCVEERKERQTGDCPCPNRQ